MSKRKLTRQQSWRIEKIQKEREARAARRTERAEAMLTGGELGPEREGLVVAHYGTQIEVESEPGTRHRCHLRANLDALVTGDKVIWCEGEPLGVVVATTERTSVLSRPDSSGKLKPVAANIDQIFVVIAPYPEAHANLVDRYLVAAETVGIAPVIVLNKVDLLDQDDRLRTVLNDLLQTYRTLGYPIVETSTTSDALADLEHRLTGRTSIFVGQSGVGKSSLVNTLLPEADIRVGELSEQSLKGTHTTTTAKLFHLHHGGQLIDSPGIREFGLWHMQREEVEQGFIEFRPHLGRCKFRNCEHVSEPGCALLAAVEAGTISQTRMASYRHIVNAPGAP